MKSHRVKNKHIGLKISILILVLALIGAGTYFLFNQYILNNNQENKDILSVIAVNEINDTNNINNSVNEENNTQSNTQINDNNNNQTDNSDEIFAQYYKKAEEKMKTMTIEEKASQMFMARCPASDSEAISLISKYQPGGYILFGRDFENKSKQEVINMIQSYQNESKIPLIIGTDEEGGTVVRVSSNSNLVSSKYKSPQDLYKNGGLTAIENDAVKKSSLLLSLGINMNLAPVCDVSTSSSDFIYKRSFGKNADQTAEYVKTVVTAMKSQNISCTLKHFPGYGNNKDSHTAVTYDNRSLETFKTSDFIPFKAGIDAGAQSILVCHNIVKSIDENNPASLSEKVHKILRQELGFSGLILTDDLAMDAVSTVMTEEEAAVKAVQSGNDIILTSDFTKQRNAVVEAIKNRTISEERIDESARRIIAYKYYMNILQ